MGRFYSKRAELLARWSLGGNGKRGLARICTMCGVFGAPWYSEPGGGVTRCCAGLALSRGEPLDWRGAALSDGRAVKAGLRFGCYVVPYIVTLRQYASNSTCFRVTRSVTSQGALGVPSDRKGPYARGVPYRVTFCDHPAGRPEPHPYFATTKSPNHVVQCFIPPTCRVPPLSNWIPQRKESGLTSPRPRLLRARRLTKRNPT
jgi:hypothetical protein